MIYITDAKKGFRCGCNACRESDADIEIRFTTSEFSGGIVISLCNECASELKAKIHSKEM